jgi:hypothetical protein
MSFIRLMKDKSHQERGGNVFHKADEGHFSPKRRRKCLSLIKFSGKILLNGKLWSKYKQLREKFVFLLVKCPLMNTQNFKVILKNSSYSLFRFNYPTPFVNYICCYFNAWKKDP